MIRDGKESTLQRWSRRKQEATQATPELSPELSPDTPDSLGATAPIEDKAKPALTDADMPAIESLDQDSDYSGFMSEGVSDELRNLALRKLFKAPVFNIRDGLDEYDEDYTYFEKLGDIVTCDMKHHIEMKEQREREALEAAEEAETVARETDVEAEAAAETDDEMEPMEVIEDDFDEQPEIVAAAEPETKPDKNEIDE